MAITATEKDALYSSTFDTFVRGRNIDEDDEFWSDEDWAAWEERLVWLRIMGAV
jgi:hypothetical protein